MTTSQRHRLDIVREREVFRLLPQLLDDSSPPLPRLLPPPGLPPSPDCAELPSSTHDVVLAGLAQLAALRLNTRRCLVSLFDRRRQLVVAEATQDSSLLPDTQTRGQIWLGGVAFPHSFGVCGHMLDRTTPGASMLSAPAAVSVSVVPDLTLDPILGSLPFVTASPLNRFYAGVSLVSSAGITLGMLCVLDDVPRLGLDQTQLDFLHQLSHAVTSHIESSQPAATVRRASKMVRGLGDFFEHWNSSTKRPDDQPDLDGNAEHHGAVPHRPQPVPLQPSARVEEAVQGTSSDEQLGSTADTVVNVSADSTKTIRTLLPEQDPITSDAMAIFGRAAKIIRDSIEVDSVAFLDAHISSFGGLVHDAATTGFKAERQVLAGQTPADDSTSGSTSCPVLGASYASVTAGTKCGPDISERVLLSLVKRYPSGKVFAFDEDGTPILTTDNKRMPESCDITGADDSPDSEQLPTPLASDTSLSECARHGEVAEQSFYTLMSSIFPRARSVALVPLWDAAKEQWYAGCLAWTESPTRSFMLDGEISYLRAFAATIMAEVDHLDAFASERANNALLGSISHELRSPLHGITAALELLQDTKLTPSQVGILRTMNHCGHTLLDVIDHLLDFSKINTLARSGRNRGVGANQARMSKSQDKTGDLSGPKPLRLPVVELDALVEETTDSIFSGLSFGRTLQPGSALGTLDSPCSTRAQSRHHSTRSNSILSTESLMSWASDLSPEESSSAAVSVYLRTAPHVSWLCHVDSGAVRRIIMNLLGNALKYTDVGFVKVSIDQIDRQTDDRSSSKHLVLKVVDSGRGIDPDFLQNRAFKPFSQEDALSQGTGLGLSLVREIVQALGGSLHIESQLRCGTSVTVELPMQLSEDVQPPSPVWRHVIALKGLRAVLRGFHAEAGVRGIPGSTPPAELAIITAICRDWLHLDIVPADAVDIRPYIVICTKKSAERLVAASVQSSPPVVVVCESIITAHEFVQRHVKGYRGRIFETIPQPVGPRKLAEVVMSAIGRYNDAKVSELVGPITEAQPYSFIDSLVTPDFVSGSEFPFMADWIAQSSPRGPSSLRPPAQRMASIDANLESASSSTAPGELPSSDTRVDDYRGSQTPVLDFVADSTAAVSRDQFLLVDDNVINLKILIAFMKKLGRPYQTAGDGQEALDKYMAHPDVFSHIIMDISMPVMNGLESTRRIRQFELSQELSPVKVIALTGLASAAVQKEAFGSGVDVFLTKPMRFKDLSTSTH